MVRRTFIGFGLGFITVLNMHGQKGRTPSVRVMKVTDTSITLLWGGRKRR